MRRLLYNLIAAFFVTGAMATDDPYYRINIDRQNQSDKFSIETHQSASETIRAYLYLNGQPWVATNGYYGRFGYGLNRQDSTNLVLVNGTMDSTTNFMSFSLSPTNLNTNGNFFCQIVISNAVGTQWVWNDGMIKIGKSPITGSTTPISLATVFNWDQYTYIGTPPYPALTNANIFTSTNTFTARQYFNGGITCNGTNLLTTVDAKADTTYVDNANTTNRTLSDTLYRSNFAGTPITNGANVSALVNDSSYVTASVTNGILSSAKSYTDASASTNRTLSDSLYRATFAGTPVTNGANNSVLVNDANYVTASVTNGILTAAKDYTDAATNGAYASAKAYTDAATNNCITNIIHGGITATGQISRTAQGVTVSFPMSITNLFAGPATTGLVTSTTADTNSLLRGNGNWTPMMLVTNDATAGYDNIVCGDVTNNATNILYITKASITGEVATALSGHQALTTSAHGGVYAAGSTVVAATNANSATYAVTANNSSNLAGLAASEYATNGYNFTRNPQIDGTNIPTKAYVDAGVQGSLVGYLSTNKTLVYTNGFSATNDIYFAITSFTNPVGTVSLVTTTNGAYIGGWIFTNYPITRLAAGEAKVDFWANENSAGSASATAHLYLYDSVSSNLQDFGDEDLVGSPVAAGTTPGKISVTVPHPALDTNNICYLAIRLKTTQLSGTPIIIISVQDGYNSAFSLNVPIDVYTADLAKKATTLTVNGNTGTLSTNNNWNITSVSSATSATYAAVAGVASNLTAAWWDVNSTNTIIGNDPGSNSIGSANTFLGKQSAKGAFALSESVFVGEQTGYSAPSNSYSVFVGKEAGSLMNSTAGLSVGVGYQSLKSCIGQKNTCVGEQAGFLLQGLENEAFGLGTMASAVGSYNSIYGNLAGTALQGSYNVSVGRANLYPLIGDYNTAIGNGALRYCTNYWTVCVGAGAGMYNSGISNVALGANSLTNWTGSNAVCIGAEVQPVGNNSVTIGNAQNTNVTIRGTVWANGAGITNATIKDPAYAQLTNGWDYSTASFVTNGTYGYLSLTNLVPVTTRGVYIRVLFTPVAAGSSIWFMSGSDFDAWSSGQMAIRGQVASVALEQHLMLSCTNQAIRYTTTSGGVVNVSLKVMHYWE